MFPYRTIQSDIPRKGTCHPTRTHPTVQGRAFMLAAVRLTRMQRRTEILSSTLRKASCFQPHHERRPFYHGFPSTWDCISKYGSKMRQCKHRDLVHDTMCRQKSTRRCGVFRWSTKMNRRSGNRRELVAIAILSTCRSIADLSSGTHALEDAPELQASAESFAAHYIARAASCKASSSSPFYINNSCRRPNPTWFATVSLPPTTSDGRTF